MGKRICCFCESWESGGIESFLHNILLHMDLTDMEVDLVAARVEDSVFTAPLEAKGVRLIALSGAQRSPRNLFRFRALLRRRRYDVVHFNLFQGLSLCYVQLARAEGVPVRIAHSHNTDLRKSRGRWAKLLLHRMGRTLFTGAATDLWACSGAAAEFLFAPARLRKKGFRFIPNGIETGRFHFDPAERDAVRAQLGLTDRFVIGNVGRLCDQKNQDFLLDVFAEAVRRRPESRLLLVGEGEPEKVLRDKAGRLGIADRVIFYGVTDRVERLFWAMDVFAFPSLFEGLGIVAVEAQATGLPVLCSQHVPREARVSDWMETVPLTEGAAVWAGKLVNCTARLREEGAQTVRRNGFDVRDVARAVWEAYGGERAR